MKLFLAVAAVLAWLFGAALLIVPSQFYEPTGIEMTPMMATVAQAHGATRVGLGVVDWLARGAERGGLVAVLAGNLVVQVLSLGVAIRTMTLGAGSAVAPALVIHVVCWAACSRSSWRGPARRNALAHGRSWSCYPWHHVEGASRTGTRHGQAGPRPVRGDPQQPGGDR
jgi:hypothetical protein